jgi:hypothetical protein
MSNWRTNFSKYEGCLKSNETATVIMFSGMDQDGACTMLLPEVCLATIVKVIIFHIICVFAQALIRNLFCNSKAKHYFIRFKQLIEDLPQG